MAVYRCPVAQTPALLGRDPRPPGDGHPPLLCGKHRPEREIRRRPRLGGRRARNLCYEVIRASRTWCRIRARTAPEGEAFSHQLHSASGTGARHVACMRARHTNSTLLWCLCTTLSEHMCKCTHACTHIDSQSSNNMGFHGRVHFTWIFFSKYGKCIFSSVRSS